MTNTSLLPCINGIEFENSCIMYVHTNNDKTYIVPLEKFPVIKNLSSEEKKDFEIIDKKYLSFLSIDEIYSVEDLIGT